MMDDRCAKGGLSLLGKNKRLAAVRHGSRRAGRSTCAGSSGLDLVGRKTRLSPRADQFNHGDAPNKLTGS